MIPWLLLALTSQAAPRCTEYVGDVRVGLERSRKVDDHVEIDQLTRAVAAAADMGCCEAAVALTEALAEADGLFFDRTYLLLQLRRFDCVDIRAPCLEQLLLRVVACDPSVEDDAMPAMAATIHLTNDYIESVLLEARPGHQQCSSGLDHDDVVLQAARVAAGRAEFIKPLLDGLIDEDERKGFTLFFGPRDLELISSRVPRTAVCEAMRELSREELREMPDLLEDVLWQRCRADEPQR